jgi:Dolichyl-phosphate-mannose-protein mannosyltransferase
VAIHLGGHSVGINLIIALVVPATALLLAVALSTSARQAARHLARSRFDRSVAILVGLLFAFTLIPSGPVGRQVVVYLAFATAGFTLLIIGVWPDLFPRAQPLIAAALRRFRNAPSTYYLGAVFLLVFLPANLVSYFVFDHIPHVQDSIAQLFQAEIFAHGHLTLPPPQHPRFFDYTHVINAPRWYSQFPPGHPAVLTLGVWLHMPWIVNPLLGAATVLVIYLLGREVYGDDVGRVGAVLAALSPFLIFMSSEYMNHSSALLFLALFLLFFARTVRTRSWLWPALAGLTLGIGVTIRPLSAVAVALPFVLYSFYLVGRDLRGMLPSFVLLGLVGLVAVGGLLLYNQRTNGSPWEFGYIAKHGEGHEIGFGHSGWGKPHTPRRGLIQSLNNLNALQRYLFEWPIPSLLIVAVLFLSRRWQLWDFLLLASWASLVVAYFFYWYQDLCFGPRFQYEALPALVLLTARGLQSTPELLRDRFGMRVTRREVRNGTALIVVLCFANMIGVGLPPLLKVYGNGYWRVNDEVYRSVRAHKLENALVFVNSNYGDAFLGNFQHGLNLNGPVVYARNIAGAGTTLMAAYPGRHYYLSDGPTLSEIQKPPDLFPAQVRKWNPKWHVVQCGAGEEPGVLRSFGGRKVVLRTYPVDHDTPCVLATTVQLPRDKTQALELCVAGDQSDGTWGLKVYVDGHLRDQRLIKGDRNRVHWEVIRYKLASYAGRSVIVRLENHTDGGQRPVGYWGYARIVPTEAPAKCPPTARSSTEDQVGD